MKENARKFLELASKDEALKQELTTAWAEAAKGKEAREAVTEAAAQASAKVAAAHGHNIAVEDFKAEKNMYLLSEEELQSVAGGVNFTPQKVTSTCSCNRSGDGYTWELDCHCEGSGNGYNTTNGHWRCGCSESGIGLA